MEVMEAKEAQARANLFLLGFFGGSKSDKFVAFFSWSSMAILMSVLQCESGARWKKKREVKGEDEDGVSYIDPDKWDDGRVNGKRNST